MGAVHVKTGTATNASVNIAMIASSVLYSIKIVSGFKNWDLYLGYDSINLYFCSKADNNHGELWWCGDEIKYNPCDEYTGRSFTWRKLDHVKALAIINKAITTTITRPLLFTTVSRGTEYYEHIYCKLGFQF